MYIRVYSPDGQMFEVTRERADTLILEKGWTQTPHITSVESEQETAQEDDKTLDIVNIFKEQPASGDKDIKTKAAQDSSVKKKRERRKVPRE